METILLCQASEFCCPLKVKKGIRAYLVCTSSKNTESKQHGSDTDQQLQNQKDH